MFPKKEIQEGEEDQKEKRGVDGIKKRHTKKKGLFVDDESVRKGKKNGKVRKGLRRRDIRPGEPHFTKKSFSF